MNGVLRDPMDLAEVAFELTLAFPTPCLQKSRAFGTVSSGLKLKESNNLSLNVIQNWLRLLLPILKGGPEDNKRYYGRLISCFKVIGV